MPSNAYFLAKIRFDTAENEPAKNMQNFAKFANFADPGAPLGGADPLGANIDEQLTLRGDDAGNWRKERQNLLAEIEELRAKVSRLICPLPRQFSTVPLR